MAQGKPWLEYWSRDYDDNGKIRTRTLFKVEEGYILSDDTSFNDANLVQYLETGRPKHYDKFTDEAWTKHCVWNEDKNGYDTFVLRGGKWVQVPLSI